MFRVFSYLHTISLYPAARLIITAQSEWQRLTTRWQVPGVHIEAPYDGQRILLLALYEKGVLRPDVLRLLRAAKDAGLYVLAVNTLQLSDPASLKGLVDCYIERPNFGRDFGSYQTGFQHVFNRGWHEKCPRLMMLNDSVFFSEERMPKFLQDMMTSDVEVLGSTENYEIEYHLGSFCISMSQSVLKQPVFRKYWRRYRLSDVRRTVIRNGEMRLSKTLKRCVSSPGQFRALYSSANFVRCLNQDPELASFFIKNSRTSSLVGGEPFNAVNILQLLQGRFIVPRNISENSSSTEIQINAHLDDLNEELFIQDVKSLKAYISRHLRNAGHIDDSLLEDAIISVLSEIFMSGSQIHQNAATLLHMGLPIVKLDGLYRGMFNIYDIQRITRNLSPVESAELEQILMERPFGGKTLVGWRRAAFMLGLL